MQFLTVFLLGAALSMDALAVSISEGISMPYAPKKEALKLAFAFGFFQALMPTIGFFAAQSCYSCIEAVDHWIAFGLLFFIGAKMMKEAFEASEEEVASKQSVPLKEVLILAVATSIDAFAAGISLKMADGGKMTADIGSDSIWLAVAIIGVTTFVFSYVGTLFGKRLGRRFGKIMEIIGGVVLINIGLKILLEGLGFLK